MSSKPPVLTTIRNPIDPGADTGVQFSVGDSKAFASFVKGAKNVASTIREVNNALQTVANIIKAAISRISSGTNLFQGIIAIGKSIVEDALALGGHVIVVHPWNQRNKEYKSLIYTANSQKKNRRVPLDANPDEYIFSRVADFFDDAVDAVSASSTEPEILNLGVPLLTVQGAINEVIWACDNIKDPLRPKFTNRMYSTGVGMIANVTNPLDLNPLIDAFKALFDFSEFDNISRELEKNYEAFKKQMESRGTDYLSALLDPREGAYAQYQEEWAALGIKTDMETLSVAEGQEEVDRAAKANRGRPLNQRKGPQLQPNIKDIQYDINLLRDTIGKVLLTGDSGPRWFGLRLDMIPVLKELKETITYLIDAATYFTSFVSQSLIDVLTIIMKQVQFTMDNLEKIASILNSLDSLQASFLAGGVWFFFIEPEIGGLTHIKEDLQALIPMIPNSDVDGYTLMIFLTAGYPDYGSSNAYLQRLREIMGDFDDTPKEAYGLSIYLEPSPSSSYAITHFNPTIPLEVKTLTDRDFKYRYFYRRYPADDPLNAVVYTSGIKDSSNVVQLQVLSDYVYELEVRADTKESSGFPEKDFDIIYSTFRVIRKIEMIVNSGDAAIETIDDNYYIHVPITIIIYNFQVPTLLRYNGAQTAVMDIIDYTISTNEDDIDYAEVVFDAVYLVIFTGGRPNAVSDTVEGVQGELSEKDSFTISSKKIINLINETNDPIGPETTPIPPEPDGPEVTSPIEWPPVEEDSDIFCISELIARYLDRNIRCELILPEGQGRSFVLYDCQNTINSVRFYTIHNPTKYDSEQEDAGSIRIPTNDYYYSIATTTTPVFFELQNLIRGYYVIRLDIYWKPGTFRYQKAGGILPQEFEIYIQIVAGETKCFLKE